MFYYYNMSDNLLSVLGPLGSTSENNYKESTFDEKVFNLDGGKYTFEDLKKKYDFSKKNEHIENILEESLDRNDDHQETNNIFDDKIFSMEGGNVITDTISFFTDLISKINEYFKNDTNIKDALIKLISLVIVIHVKGLYNSVITDDGKINRNSPIVSAVCTLIVAVLNDQDSGYRAKKIVTNDDVIKGFSENLFYLPQLIPFFINKILKMIGLVKSAHGKYKTKSTTQMEGGIIGVDDLTIGTLIVCCIFILGLAGLSYCDNTPRHYNYYSSSDYVFSILFIACTSNTINANISYINKI